jgi:hypothetical protein
MSNVVYAYTSKGRKEKCGKGGVGCVRHPLHITNGSAKANTWFGSGVIEDAMKFFEADGGSNTSNEAVGLAAYEDATTPKKFVSKDMYTLEEKAELVAAAAPYKELAVKLIEEKGFATVRKEGIGTNFKVINPEDGFRKDGAVWFGKCDTCGGHVASSRFEEGWTHNVTTPIFDKDGVPYTSGRSTNVIYACPEAL